MLSLSVSDARADLYRIVDNVNQDHKPSLIVSKRGNAVLVAETDWNAIQETLFLLSIQGMRESIIEGKQTPDDECSEELNW